MIGTLTDYTQSVKEYVPVGKNKSRWEEFFTGTTSQYQTLTQQTQDVYAYDISSAYANYKQQQLQLQMNQQLGEGFKQQLGTQLQSQYGSAFADIKSQEASALSKVDTKYLKDIAEGEEEFAKIGKRVKQFDQLLHDYAKAGDNPIAMLSEDVMYDKEGNLTDTGRLWYYDVYNRPDMKDMKFRDWLRSENALTNVSLEDRETIFEELSGPNANLYLEAVAGISDWTLDKAKEIRLRTQHNMDEKEQVSPVYKGSATGYDMRADKQEFTNVETGEKYTSKVGLSSDLSKNIIQNTPDLEQNLKSKKLEIGDVIEYGGKEYVISHWQIKNGKLQVEFYKNASSKDELLETTPLNYEKLSQNQQQSLLKHKERNSDVVSKHTHSSYNYNNERGETLIDDYGHEWYIKKQNALDLKDISSIDTYERGDIVLLNKKYYVVDTVHVSAGRLLLKELENKE